MGLVAARRRRIFCHNFRHCRLPHEIPGIPGIIPACRMFAKNRYQVEIITRGALFDRYRFATKVRAPLAWFSVSRGRGCLRETPAVDHTTLAPHIFAGPALLCSPVPRCVSPCPESENAGATTMAIHFPPRANTRPKPAAMPAVHPLAGRLHGACTAFLGPMTSTPALAVLSRHPGCHDAPPAVSREIFRSDTLALPRQDYRSHTAAAYAATASAPFFPGNPDFRGRWVPRSSRTPITKQGMNFEAKH